MRWGGPQHRPRRELQWLTEILSHLWQNTKLEINHTEAYWRLTVDGIPVLDNSHMRRAAVERCGCGVRSGQSGSRDTPRKDHFWVCLVARAVVGQVEPKLGVALMRANLWLVQAPEQAKQCVWDFVMMAATAAMETRRRFLAAAMRRRADQGEAGLMMIVTFQPRHVTTQRCHAPLQRRGNCGHSRMQIPTMLPAGQRRQMLQIHLRAVSVCLHRAGKSGHRAISLR
jgi:hypothetical protein